MLSYMFPPPPGGVGRSGEGGGLENVTWDLGGLNLHLRTPPPGCVGRSKGCVGGLKNVSCNLAGLELHVFKTLSG